MKHVCDEQLEQELKFVFCWDNPDEGVAYNLYACALCGAVLKEHVWDGAGTTVLLAKESFPRTLGAHVP